MPTQDQYMQALRKADAAGDTEGARRIAEMMKTDSGVVTPGMDRMGLPTDPAKRQEEISRRAQQLTLGDMSNTDKFIAGMGKNFHDTYQGAQQLGAWLGSKAPGAVGDYFSQQGQQIKDERAGNAGADEALSDTGAGKAGELGGMLATSLIPIGGTEALGARALEAAGGSKAAQVLARALASRTGQGVVAGAAQGAVQPVVNDDERAGNVAFGAGAGAAAPQAARLLRGGAVLASHAPGLKLLAPVLGFDSGAAAATKKAAAAAASRFETQQAQRLADKAEKQAVKDAAVAAKAKAIAVRQQAGKTMSSILTPNVKVPISPEVARELKAVQSQYTGSLSADAHVALDKLQTAAQMGGKVRGDMIARMREGAIKEAANNKGAVSGGYSAIQRSLDKAVDQHVSPEDAARLARARTMYRTGMEPPAATPTPQAVPLQPRPGSSAAFKEWLAKQSQLDPNAKLYQDALVRGAVQETQQ